MDTILTDADLIREIAGRAADHYGVHPMTFILDILACHDTTPLRLQELLAADDVNFYHDIGGINKNLDRCTYKLLNNFVPRFVVVQ